MRQGREHAWADAAHEGVEPPCHAPGGTEHAGELGGAVPLLRKVTAVPEKPQLPARSGKGPSCPVECRQDPLLEAERGEEVNCAPE